MDIDYSSTDPIPDVPSSADLARQACVEAATNRSTPVNEAEFVEFIERGAASVTPPVFQSLVQDLPEVHKKITALKTSNFPNAPVQLTFLADVVEGFAQERPSHENLPFQAVIEAAFALLYLMRSTDLIPDSLGPVGYTDDAAVAATVIERNAEPFRKLAHELKRDWTTILRESRFQV